MTHLDGRTIGSKLDLDTDVVVVGSGPAGSAVARRLSALGLLVVVIEAGQWFDPLDYPESAFESMARLYRDMSASVVLGKAPLPYVQGKMVGGSSPINGAICWRMPRDVYDEWISADPRLAETLNWDVLEAVTDEIETRLNVLPTDPAIAGPKNLLMAKGAEALGIEHRPIRRNVRNCMGMGRCIQGCPAARKQSVEATLLADALQNKTQVLSSAEVQQIIVDKGRAKGVRGRLAATHTPFEVRAKHAVVLAASAVQTPALLLHNGIKHGPVGRNFQCHPGVSMAGRFPDMVRMWEGATQGHEVIGLRHEGLKFEALGFGLGIMAGRLNGVGRALAEEVEHMPYHLDWGAAVRAEAKGRVVSFRGKPYVVYQPTPRDVHTFRRGLRVLGEMMLAAGAIEVMPGVRGVVEKTSSLADLVRLQDSGPGSATAYKAAITHMFGTCRMGSDPGTSVVGTDFQHHAVKDLFVADSSVFPTNIGVNPQIPIMAIGTLCANKIHEKMT